MNEKGYSWPEAILTLTIMIVVFGTLLPFGSHMSAKLQDKRLTMHAMEAALKGAILYQAYGQALGVISIEDTQYQWKVSGSQVCVSYTYRNRAEEKCVY